MTEQTWNTKTPKGPKEPEPPKPGPLRPGETATRNTIRLVDGSLVTAEALGQIGQSLSTFRAGEQIFVGLPSGLCVRLEDLEAAAGSSEPNALRTAASAFAAPDTFEPEPHPTPLPGSYLAHTIHGEAVKIVSKIDDPVKGAGFERLISDDARIFVPLDYSPFLMLRQEHIAANPEKYAQPNEAEEDSRNRPAEEGKVRT